MQWQPPHVVGKVFCVGERVQEPQCGKQQLIDLYELYQGAYVFNGSNSLQKNCGNSTKQRTSNADNRSDDKFTFYENQSLITMFTAAYYQTRKGAK